MTDSPPGINPWGNGPEDSIKDPEETRVLFSALDSFSQYARSAHFNCTHLRRQSFYALPQHHWKMLAAPPFNYLDTLERVDVAIERNGELARAILDSGLQSFNQPALVSSGPLADQGGEDRSGRDSERQSAGVTVPRTWAGCANHTDIEKARSTLRQFFRDWSAEGAHERNASYGPIFSALKAEKERRRGLPSESNTPTGKRLHVLVPGAGLGRLVFELCVQGYVAEGNEISYHQLLASSYVLNHTSCVGQHTIYPWVHAFSNHRTREDHLRGYGVPDVHPPTVLSAAGDNAGLMSMCAADFLCLYGDETHRDRYDAVACVFFLDTAPNLIRYLETIRQCLKPGGVLVNVGPLLWHFENQPPGRYDENGMVPDPDANETSGIADPGSFELSEDEVMTLVTKMGFELERRETGFQTPYIHDSRSMLQTVYHGSSWVARKLRL